MSVCHSQLCACDIQHFTLFLLSTPCRGDAYCFQLLEAGVKYMFVSNSDNLGATLDIDLLAYFATTDKSFLMEVCER